ncbi:MAG: VOC family protein [Bauldia sp.]|nr:VOC family protein [Bauldia sp.]
MSGREDPKPSPIECYLIVDDAEAAIAFYRRAFGATEIARRAAPDGRRLLHCALALFGGRIMLADEFPELISDTVAPKRVGGTSVTMNVNLATPAAVDATLAQAEAAGAAITTPATDAPWGTRYARLIDPFGHAWALQAPLPED